MVASGLLYFALRSSAPLYQGKTSAQWFREFQAAATRHWTIQFVNPSFAPGSLRVLDLQALLREPAANGLRALGTNAAVYLGHQFARKDGILARTYGKLYLQLPVRTAVAARCLARALSAGDITLRRSSLNELERCGTSAALALSPLTAALKDPDEQVRYGAARAFEAIGSAAVGAIPALTQATNDVSVMVQRASARALRVIQGQRRD